METREERIQEVKRFRSFFGSDAVGSDVDPVSCKKKNDSSDGDNLMHNDTLSLTIMRRITSTGIRISALNKVEDGTKDPSIDDGLIVKTRVNDEVEIADGSDAVLKNEVDMDLAPPSVRKMPFDELTEVGNTKVMSQEECLKTQFDDHPVPSATNVPVVANTDNGLESVDRVKGGDVFQAELQGSGCPDEIETVSESTIKMSFDEFLRATNTKVMSKEECLRAQIEVEPAPFAEAVPVAVNANNCVESTVRVKEEPDVSSDVFQSETDVPGCQKKNLSFESTRNMSFHEFLQATNTKVMSPEECSRTQFLVQPMPLTVVMPAAVKADHGLESGISVKEEPGVGNETRIDVKHHTQEPNSVKTEPSNEAMEVDSTDIMPVQEPITGFENKVSVKAEVVDSESTVIEEPNLALVPYASGSTKNEGGGNRASPCDFPAKKVKVEDRTHPTLSCVVIEDWDFPEEPDWYLVGRKVVFATSTAKGRKLCNNEIVYFTFPTTSSRFNSPLIVRFSTKRYGEIGRLPMEWATCVVPLVRSTKVKVLGRCIDGDKSLKIGDIVTLYMSYYIHHTIFTEHLDTSWTLDARVNINSTMYPLLTLFTMLDINPYQKAEFTPQELISRKRKLDLEGESGEVSSMLPLVKRNGYQKHPGQADSEQVVSESTLNKLVGATEVYDLEEMEPPNTLLSDLKPYQKQALHWMSGLEEGVDVEKAAKTLHPCWSAYRICDKRASSIYLNNFSGEVTTQLPSAMQMARGGILADAMGLGKTVMTIALILARPGRGRPDSEEAAAVDYDEIKRKKNSCRSTTLKAKGGTLVICPMALLGQWKDELETHSEEGSISIFVHYGGDRTNDPKTMSQHDVVLTTYGVLTAAYKHDVENSIFHKVNWYRVVLDEAHTIKASKTQAAQAAFSLPSYCRWCLTGTPLQNNLEDLYSLLCFLHVEPWCNWAWWSKLIQKPYENGDPRGLRTVKAILRPLMLRRTKETKDKDGRPILVLPPTDIQIIECEQSEAEHDFYDALFKRSKVQFDQFVAQGKVLHNYANILELLLRLRQCCNHPFLVMSRADSKKYADLNKLSKRFLKSNSDSDSTKQKVPSRAYVEEVVEGIGKGENAECSICMESADDPVLTPCAHRMCRECLLSSWRSPTMGHCPLCRELIKKSDLITCPSVGCFRIDVEKNWKESSKVSQLLNCLEEIRRSDSGEKCIVFSQWTTFLDLLEIPLKTKRIGFLRYDGQLAQKQREKVLKEFNETRGKMVLLMSLKAGGVGLNLTAASNVFLMDPWWNPAVEEQAIMRIHRIGQKRKVVVRRFIVRATVEERLHQVQFRKQRMIAGALTDDEVRTSRIEELKMLFR